MNNTTVPDGTYRLGLRFVGSGSEYFRIWIVNLLLTLVTLSLYYPFAKVRRLRYFHNATELGGHALSFHADPWKMFRGYLLVGVLAMVYGLAGKVSPVAGGVAFLIMAALWPALWHSSLRFRLANTGWRGVRARFTGTRGGAYMAMLPFFSIAVLFVLIGISAASQHRQPPSPWLGLVLPVLLLALPAMLWLIKRYQHNHYGLAQESSRFEVRTRSYYNLALRGLGVMLLVGLAASATMSLFAGGLRFQRAGFDGGTLFRILIVVAVFYVLLLSLIGPYFTARLQNLVWNGTRSHNLQFESTLRYRKLALLTCKNWLLTIVTLGLYFPFAAVATARLRLQAVSVSSQIDPDQLVQQGRSAQESAAGDAAGGLLGIDLGL
jgi:uncharacterized membrane protein YjgN (DUF898 family)